MKEQLRKREEFLPRGLFPPPGQVDCTEFKKWVDVVDVMADWHSPVITGDDAFPRQPPLSTRSEPLPLLDREG